MRQVVANKRLKQWKIINHQAQKVVARVHGHLQEVVVH